MADETTSAFSANETKIIMAVMQNLTADIKFDIEKVAAQLGYQDSASFRARWNTIKRKKLTGAAAAPATPAGGVSKSPATKKSKSTPKSASKKTQKKGKGGNSDDEELFKPMNGGKAKGGHKVKTEEGEDDEDVVESILDDGECQCSSAFGGDLED